MVRYQELVVTEASSGMRVSDRVEIRYPDGVVERGPIANIDASTVMVRHHRARRDAGAIIVHAARLQKAALRHWALEL